MLPPTIKIDVRHVRYAVVREALEDLGNPLTTDDHSALIVWWDGFMPPEEWGGVFPYQRINKIPGMDVMCYKTTFFQAVARMKLQHPSQYAAFPSTYQIPFQFSEFQREHIRLSAKCAPVTWIVKPRNGCCGNGIKLIQNSFDIVGQTQPAIIQRYISPYLIDGYKFDFRIYLFIATLQPFTCYVYNEGLARFCTHKYCPPTRETLDDQFCHLTNTAVNVTNNERSNPILELASAVISRMAGKDPRAGTLWLRIKRVALLAILAQQQNIIRHIGLASTDPGFESDGGPNPALPGPILDDMARFFHILGIDILINDRCEPCVLELNDRPSMSVTYEIEQVLKRQLVRDALNLVTVDGKPASDEVSPGGWEKVFPDPSTAFGREAEEILLRSCPPSQTPKRTVVKRLGYVPSVSKLRRIFRAPLGLPPLQQ
jgi:hypothetical protein